SLWARNFSMGMARLTWGASPRRSEVTPITLPAAFTSAAPPNAELYGATMKARSSMYSHAAANDRTDSTRLGVETRSPSSVTPTVPVTSPAATLFESPSVAAGHGPRPSRWITTAPHFHSAAVQRRGHRPT